MTEKTYEEKLFENLKKLPNRVWFKIHDRPDVEKFTAAVKYFIEMKNDFELSEDLRNIRRVSTDYHEMENLPQGMRIEIIQPGHTEQWNIKHLSGWLEHRTTSYRVYNGDKLISIES